jgi:hypothetical protein
MLLNFLLKIIRKGICAMSADHEKSDYPVNPYTSIKSDAVKERTLKHKHDTTYRLVTRAVLVLSIPATLAAIALIMWRLPMIYQMLP